MDKKQILMLHGGGSFESEEKFLAHLETLDLNYGRTKGWKDWLAWSLEDKYEFIRPSFPNSNYASFHVWKLWLEKHLPLLKDDLVIISHSLGTIFIVKYLLENNMENKFPKIKELHLVAPIVDDSFQPADDVEQVGNFEFDYKNVKDLEKKCEQIFVWHSTDDDSCNYKNSQFLKEQIPDITLKTFSDRGHFRQSTFPELYDHFR